LKLYTDHKLGCNNPLDLGQINCYETAASDLYIRCTVQILETD